MVLRGRWFWRNGVTTLPHLRDLVVNGPFNTTGLSLTPSRAKIFTCRPTLAAEERPCATEILTRLATAAYRRTLTAGDIDGLMGFYDEGTARGGFEEGIRTALEAILASPHFVLRIERQPAGIMPGETYRVSAQDMASRLSFFLWGTTPDAELQTLAAAGRLSDPDVLEQQAKRMLADPRAEALGSRFAGQWFRLQDLYKVRPDPNFFPNFDENLADLMRHETESFFYNLVQEDRSALELYSADYTFVNERLADHYGISGVAGTNFRRIAYPDDKRVGLLGHGQHPGADIVRQPNVARVARQVGDGSPDRIAATGAASQRAAARRDRRRRGRQVAHDGRADGVASCEPGMQRVPQNDGSNRPRARQLRRDGEMARAGERSVRRHAQRILRRDPDIEPGRTRRTLLRRPKSLVRTLAENLMAFALGRRVEYFDQPTIRAIVSEAEANDYRMSSFFLGVIKSDAFQMKRVEPVTTDDAMAAGQQ